MSSIINGRWIVTASALILPLAAAAPLPETSASSILIAPSFASPVYRTISNSPTAIATLSETLTTLMPMMTDFPAPTNADQVSPLLFGAPHNAMTVGPTSSWAAPPTFSNMTTFSVSTYAAGAANLAVLAGSPAPVTNGSDVSTDSTYSWDSHHNSLQVLYPQGSMNPGNKPQGGAEFYSHPIDMTQATNASLEYSVYFPPDFDFVKGGKLPGLYGGHKGCSGGNAAEDCFSTRLMWRTGGLGELYLYAPKDKQTPALCQTKPKSLCDSQYGLSIGRGAWTFALGDWTTVRQDVWLNTPGQNDGGFNIWVDGKLVLNANDVRYRENSNACLHGQDVSSSTIDALSYGSSVNTGNDTVMVDEDWETAGPAIITSTSTSTVTVTSIIPSQSTMFHRRQQAVLTADSDTLTAMVTDAITQPATSAIPAVSTATVADASQTMIETAVPFIIPTSVPLDTAESSSLPTINDPTPIIVDAPPIEYESSRQRQDDDCAIGFMGLFFSTFFGGHTSDWASPKAQYTYFKDFGMWVNN